MFMVDHYLEEDRVTTFLCLKSKLKKDRNLSFVKLCCKMSVGLYIC